MDTIDLVIKALKTVPEKRLLLIDLANRIPIINGGFDPETVSELQPEINLAVQEVQAYGGHTIQAIDSILNLIPRREL